MSLIYPAAWKFEGIGTPLPDGAISSFQKLVSTISSGDPHPQEVTEAFKSGFGTSSWSSSPDWAESDLYSAMNEAKENPVVFVEAFWTGIENVGKTGRAVPSADFVNSLLKDLDIPLVIDPPNLLKKGGDIVLTEDSSLVVLTPHSNSYKRGEVIGKGGFGVVYRVTRTTTAGDFEFAMKVLDPSPFNNNKEKALARFNREMQILRKLQHRGIVHHIEAGLDADQRPYILMPIIEGLKLRDALSGASLIDVLLMFDELLNALGYAHSKNVIHRDLKPSNIMVRSSDRQPIILDFGCAYSFDEADEVSLTTTLIGSSAYIPAEVHRNPRLRNVKQDVYACGVLLYEVLAESLPDPDDYEPIANLRPNCVEIDQLVRAALAPAPQRIASVALLRERLQELMKSLLSPADVDRMRNSDA